MNFVSEPRAEALAARALPVLSSGLVSGLYMVIYVFSAGGIIFSGALAPFFSQGTGTILFGTFVVCLVIALTSGYRGAISALPSPAIVVLVAIGSTIALQGDVLFMTMVATMMVGALAGGTCFLTIGRFRVANLVRFIPFSVAGGFLAGTGGALCLAALPLMGVTPEWPMSPSFPEPSALWSWVPGVAYGLGLFIATKRWSSSVLLPVSFVSVAALHHLGLAFLDISGNDARAMGLLFARISQGGLVARLRARRSGTGRLGRGRDADPQHAGSDPGGPAQPGHVSERHRAGRCSRRSTDTSSPTRIVPRHRRRRRSGIRLTPVPSRTPAGSVAAPPPTANDRRDPRRRGSRKLHST